jgi:hypothetical protein
MFPTEFKRTGYDAIVFTGPIQGAGLSCGLIDEKAELRGRRISCGARTPTETTD